MAIIPTLENILLEVNQSVGGASFTSQKKNKFSTNTMDTKLQLEMASEILKTITNKLNLDDHAVKDLIKNLIDSGSFYKSVELHTWTGSASSQQIIWYLLAYVYTPTIARYMAFWNMDYVTDKGMSGGRFWYLPDIKTKHGKEYLQLPVANVVDWLLDLLGMPISVLGKEYRANNDPLDIKTEKLIRTLYNWGASETTPNPNKFNEFFPDNLSLNFKGTFEPDHNLSHNEQFLAAIAFVKQKFPDTESVADLIRHEIPMSQEGLIEAILNHATDEDIERRFIELLAIRYAKPSFKLVRQYFLVARMIQDGYIRLIKFLFPDVDLYCINPHKNKLLQISMLYKYIYNLSIEAHCCNRNNLTAEDQYFEEKIPLILRPLMLCVIPSLKYTSYNIVAEMLSKKFLSSNPQDELEDIYPYSEQVAENMANAVKKEHQKNLVELNIANKLKNISNSNHLEKELKKIQSFTSLIYSIDPNKPSSKHHRLIMKRLAELAKEPSEKIQITLRKLHYHLNNDIAIKTIHTSSQVHQLLTEAEQNPVFEQWKAPILQFKAKHLLAKNEFSNATSLLREALNACSEYNYGMLRSEIARDLLAVEVANRKPIPENQHRYYREMMYYGMQELAVTEFEDTAVQCSEYFWEVLYKPYPEVEKITPIALDKMKSIYKSLLPLLDKGDMRAITQWLKKQKKDTLSNLHCVTGDSFLMYWIKEYSHFMNRLPMLQMLTPCNLRKDLERFQHMMENWQKTTALIIETMPNLLNIVDFKRQSPLMLIAQTGNHNLLKLMLENKADPNLQDYIGRTALHTSIAGRHNKCVDLLLEHDCTLDKLVENRASVLHTCVRAGNTYAAKQILKRKPALKNLKDDDNITPLELVKLILNSPEDHAKLGLYMQSIGKKAASTEELNELIKLLC